MDYTVLSNKPVNIDQSKLSSLDIEIVDFNIQNASLPEGYHLIVADDIQFDATLLSKISVALAPRGFVLLVENINAIASSKLQSFNLQTVTVMENDDKKYFLLKKVSKYYYFYIILLYQIIFQVSPKYEYTILKIEDEQFSWVEALKKELADVKGNTNKKIVVYSDKNINGVLGLSKCLVEEFSGEENPIR